MVNKHKTVFAFIAFLLLSSYALAQNECGPSLLSVQGLRTRDSNGVVHDTACADPITGKMSYPFTGALAAGSVNNVCQADRQSGADAGAKINACETLIGAGTPGEIWITGGGTMTTAPVPSSNHTYRFFSGTYNWPAPFTFTSLTNFKVICEPGCIFNNTQTGYNSSNALILSTIFVDSGSAVVSPTFTSNGNVGATSIAVTACTSINPGDDIAIFDTRFSENNNVTTCSGTTLTLTRPLENNYTTARGAQVSKLIFSKNFLIRGVTGTGANSNLGSGGTIVLNNAEDGTIEDITCLSGRGRCYLAAHSSSRLVASNIRALNPSDNSIENYITSSHNSIINCWATNSTANGIAVHGFHETLVNCHSWGNAGVGLQIDNGQFINIVGGEFNANTSDGIRVSGGTLNTVEATDVVLNGVQSEDNGGDGLNAGTGGNLRLFVQGGSFIRNRGTDGNVLANGLAQGSKISGTVNWGAAAAGIAVNSATTWLSLNDNDFQGPTANGTSDIVIGTSLDFCTIVGNTFQVGISGTPGTQCAVWGERGVTYQVPAGLGAAVLLGGNALSNTSLNVPLSSGTGLQIFNTTTTCTTAGSVGATCTTGAISLPVAEGDTSYRVNCTGKGPTNVPVVSSTANSSASQFTITIAALTAAAASFSSYDCSVGHN